MKKQTLNEQSSRIKKMMGISENLESQMDTERKELSSVDEVINYITSISSKIEELSEEMREKLDGTEFWNYIKPMYSGLRSVSDMEGFYTRGDQKDENISNIIELLKSDYEIGTQSSVEDDDYDERQERNYGVDDEPSDDDIYNGFGREGGIDYDTSDSWQGR